MTPFFVLGRIDQLFSHRGGAEYHGEAVTQLEHALQAATLAEADGLPVEVIVAALLHDVGHLLHDNGEACAEQGIDDRHEELAASFLRWGFNAPVVEPIRLHVEAKRYLTAARAGYLAKLSPASIRSLELQGGPMSSEEARAFEANPHHDAAVRIREYDDAAKVVGMQTRPFDHFRQYLEAVARGSA
jgi:phosphonate degradation associated HDIG domain protein